MAKTAVELIRNPPGLQKGLKKDLGDRIAALKAFLAKNPPKDFRLIPDGPEYRVTSEAAVADASAAERPKVSAGGR